MLELFTGLSYDEDAKQAEIANETGAKGMKNWAGAVLTIVSICLASLPGLAQQPSFGSNTIVTTDLGNGVYMMVGSGGNLGVSVGDDGVILIDDQFAPMAEKIKAAIRDVSGGPVTYLFNTHWHGDHTGGNEIFGEGGAVIVAHDNVRKRMSEEQFVEWWNRKTQPAPEAALPVITFTQSMTFHFNGQTVRVIAAPNAHTDGDSIIHFEQADVIHMGDTFFNTQGYPYVDTSSGGSVAGMIAALDIGLSLAGPNTKIIPGHGPLATRDEMQAIRDAIADMNARVVELADQGKSLEVIIELNPLAEFDADWGKGMIKGKDLISFIHAGAAE